MTALKEFQRLECPGVWRVNANARRQNVYVSFGDSTLVLSDRAGSALTHWSLAAIRRVEGSDQVAVFSPDPDGAETLEIEDDTMAAAIDRVRATVRRQRPHPGRLRMAVVGALVAGIAALVYFWLPGALIAHTDAIVPAEKRQQIGLILLQKMVPLTGTPCSSPRGSAALARLEKRIFPNGDFGLVVVRDGVDPVTLLPGGLIVLNASLLEDFEGPEVAAGYAILSALDARNTDPMEPLLRHAGLAEVFRLLTTGNLGEDALGDYASKVVRMTPATPDPEQTLAAFEQAGFPSSPFAYAVDVTGESTIAMIEADPFRSAPYAPLLGDLDWVALQEICAR